MVSNVSIIWGICVSLKSNPNGMKTGDLHEGMKYGKKAKIETENSVAPIRRNIAEICSVVIRSFILNVLSPKTRGPGAVRLAQCPHGVSPVP